jgi:molybdopterin-dependent oxidoreductase-like protein
VPADAIEQAAYWYGTGPSLLWIGQGFQRQPRGGNAVRAVAQLAALCGNVGKPGTGFLYLNGAGNRMLDEDYIAGAHLPGSPPDPISHMDLAGCLEDPQRSRALLCWNINIAASNPEQARLRQALTRTDLFTVAIDLFATDTAGPLSLAVAIQQQRHHHLRSERRPAVPIGPVAAVEPAQIQGRHRVQHDEHHIVFGQPLAHVHRQQQRLITLREKEILRHTP